MTKPEAIKALAKWYLAKWYNDHSSDMATLEAAQHYADWYSRNVAALAVNGGMMVDVIDYAERLTIAQIERLVKDE